MNTKFLEVKNRGRVVLIKFKRDEKLNSINAELIDELEKVLKNVEKDKSQSIVVLYGNDKAFAAGADITEFHRKTFSECYRHELLQNWRCVADFSKPIIAAVSGYALGGGLEIALACDIIYAAENAQFGQPEIGLGIIPGVGGTQRLVKAIGKSKAMEMCLGSIPISAEEAYQSNLVSRVFPTDSILSETIKFADKISHFSLPVLKMIKEAINSSFETTLQQGLHLERRLFHSVFALNDSYEGIEAFLDRRSAAFNNK